MHNLLNLALENKSLKDKSRQALSSFQRLFVYSSTVGVNDAVEEANQGILQPCKNVIVWNVIQGKISMKMP